jgi:hypothetical protein
VDAAETAVEMQRLGKHFPSTTNTQATLEEVLYAVFSMRSMSYQPSICYERKAGDYFFPELLVCKEMMRFCVNFSLIQNSSP